MARQCARERLRRSPKGGRCGESAMRHGRGVVFSAQSAARRRSRDALIGAPRLASCFQMHTWWVVGPVGLSAVLLRGVFGRRGSHRRGKKDEDATREEGGLSFSCERVCTSEALLNRLGSLAKVRPPKPHFCRTAWHPTVGSATRVVLRLRLRRIRRSTRVSRSVARPVRLLKLVCLSFRLTRPSTRAAADACAEACQRAVCTSSHQVLATY